MGKKLFGQAPPLILWVGIVWLLLWIVPWGNLPTIQSGNFLAFLTEMLRLGLALFLFMFPGILYFLLIKRDAKILGGALGFLPIGLTFSVAIIGLVGLLGRLLGLSFSSVKLLFFLIGLAGILLMVVFRREIKFDAKTITSLTLAELKNPALVTALILSFLFTFHDSLFFIDDTTYLAYVTNWQYSAKLGFQNLVHDVNVIEHSRFWLAIYPISQSLLSDLSGLPGVLLLGNYLELFYVPIAVVACYWLGRNLGLSSKASGFAVAIQFSFFAWMLGEELPVGLWFYQNMSEDKLFAVFIIFPVFFIFGLEFLLGEKRENLWLFIFAGIALVFTHPIMLFYSCCIVLAVGIFALINKKATWRYIFQVGLVVVCLLLPFWVIWFYEAQTQSVVNFDAGEAKVSNNAELFVNVIDDRFYGLNPEMLKFIDLELDAPAWNTVYEVFRFMPIIISLIALIIALVHFNKGPFYWYLTVVILLITLATFPYTGWLLGAFVSPRMLSRSSWYMPLGFSAVLILKDIKAWGGGKAIFLRGNLNKKRVLNRETMGLLLVFLIALPILLTAILPQVPAYFHLLDHYKQLAQVGDFIENQEPDPTIAIGLDYYDAQFLPGVASNVRLISFRENNINPHNVFWSEEEYARRIEDTKTIRVFDNSVPNEAKCELLAQYTIQLVLANEANASLFEESVSDCGYLVSPVFSTEDLFLFEITLNN